jgi:hypothetical protein
MDVQKSRELAKSTNEAHVRREEIKDKLLTGFENKKISSLDARKLLKEAYEYLSGR